MPDALGITRRGEKKHGAERADWADVRAASAS